MMTTTKPAKRTCAERAHRNDENLIARTKTMHTYKHTLERHAHNDTQSEKCSNHQFEYKNVYGSLLLSCNPVYFARSLDACVSLKPMRMLSRAYTNAFFHHTYTRIYIYCTHIEMYVDCAPRTSASISVTMCFCLRAIAFAVAGFSVQLEHSIVCMLWHTKRVALR